MEPLALINAILRRVLAENRSWTYEAFYGNPIIKALRRARERDYGPLDVEALQRGFYEEACAAQNNEVHHFSPHYSPLPKPAPRTAKAPTKTPTAKTRKTSAKKAA
jgi:hypothetical protein